MYAYNFCSMDCDSNPSHTQRWDWHIVVFMPRIYPSLCHMTHEKDAVDLELDILDGGLSTHSV
jgi:hypothetical protein